MLVLSEEDKKKIKIFAGPSSEDLAKKVSENLGISLNLVKMNRFADGEVFIKPEESVRGCKVFVIQSTSNPVNESLMELLVFIDALRRASAEEIIAIIPYYGYARQDRTASPREPITAKLVANLLAEAGATRVVTMDLHARQAQGFFDIPVDHMEALPILAKHFIKQGFGPEDTVVVSPDVGGVKRARGLAKWLHTPLAIIDKRRQKANECEVMNIIGDVDGKKVILVDDMIDTAGTITKAADLLKSKGANSVRAMASHCIMSGPADERVDASALEEIVFTDSIPYNGTSSKVKQLSVGPLFAETIRRVLKNESISSQYLI